MRFCDETENLLSKCGLKCICQLCNCGRRHYHKGCRKTLPNTMDLSLRYGNNNTNRMVTDYQSCFGNYYFESRREPIRPFQRPKDPNPPAMDFRTENHECYKMFGNIERLPGCKLQGEIEKLTSGDFVGRTVYNDSFPAHKPKRNVLLRPATVFKPSQSQKFHTDTEYLKNFQRKNKITQESYTEAPALAYGLIYPDGATIPKKSLKNSVHDGKAGEKTKPCTPNKDHIKLGTDENVIELQTTSHDHFKNYKLSPTKSMKPSYQLQTCRKFTAMTQNEVDFKYDDNEAREARGSLCLEYPSLIKLSMDVPLDFQTVNRMSYNNFPTSAMSRQTSTKKTDVYVPRTGTFSCTTTNKSDYKHFGNQHRVGMIKQPEPRKSSAKTQKDSSYMSQYKNPGKVNLILYGAQHADNLRLPPKSEHFTKETVTKQDFQRQHGAEKPKPFKPDYNLHNVDGKIQSNTEYNDTFKTNDFDLCTFTKYLIEEEARKIL